MWLTVDTVGGMRLRALTVVLPAEMKRPGSRWAVYFPPIAHSRNSIFRVTLRSQNEDALFDDHDCPYIIVDKAFPEFECNGTPEDEEGICCTRPYSGRIESKENPYAGNGLNQGGAENPPPELWENMGLPNARVVPALRGARMHLLLPSLLSARFSGGTNTAFILASLLAKRGVRVSILSTHTPKDEDDVIRKHIADLVSDESMFGNMEFVDGHGSNHSFFGDNDLVMATAWWTATRAREIVAETSRDHFIYLIQDYEPLLYPWSGRNAMALETYAYDYVPLINCSTLAEYFFKSRPGKFADKRFRSEAVVFQPAVDKKHFYPAQSRSSVGERKTLLFYARPSAPRNMFEIGLQAIARVIHRGVINPAEWQVKLMGDSITPMEIGGGFTLESLPWMGYEDYSHNMRSATLGLSLMLSPHPSYPPLEMAACGLPVVTTPYETKTAGALRMMSRNIIAADADAGSIADGLERAIERCEKSGSTTGRAGKQTSFPESWEYALNPAINRIMELMRARPGSHGCGNARKSVYTNESYAAWKRQHLLDAEITCRLASEPCLLSIVTSAYNVASRYIDELAECILQRNDYSNFEWVLLDNGSTDAETIQAIKRWSGKKHVRYFRVENNLGIIGGMRFLLEHARGRYVFPTDSDDYIADNGLRIMAWHIQKNDFPPLLYSDEDYLTRDLFLPGYLKPDWDPVLFLNSCYIAHWCAIDREIALSLNAYSDSGAEGCHDWDTFIRFMKAGHKAVHVPVCLYSWRFHSASAAGGNMQCKPYVYDSQIHALSSYLAGKAEGNRYTVAASPFFNNSPDWYFARDKTNPRPMLSILIRGAYPKRDPKGYSSELAYPCHEAISLDIRGSLNEADKLIAKYAESGGLVHLMYDHVQESDPNWPWEAVSCFELHPDTAIVGGRICSKEGKVVAAGELFGVGGDCGSPDLGRPKSHPGYQVQLLKQRSVSAVSSMFCIVDAKFLSKFLKGCLSGVVRIPDLGAWLGAMARREGRRVVYSPFVDGTSEICWSGLITANQRAEFAALNKDIIKGEGLLHPELSLSLCSPYKYVHKARRDEFLDCCLTESVRKV
jgi:glycosyltransferase involved in cell wall biosynthesis